MPVRNLSILVVSTLISVLCYLTASRNHYGGLLSIAMSEVQRHFVRPIDDRTLFEGAMEGMMRRLDRYSDYFTPEELVEFNEDKDQVFGGVGIVVEMDSKTDQLMVASPLPGTPGYEAGIRAGDEIVAIDGKSTEGMQINEAVKLMRGKPGTTLVVSILHPLDSEPTELTITRAVISVDSVMGDVRRPDGTWEFTLAEHPRIGYIRLISFGDKSAEELRSALHALHGRIDGLILDLRGNGGGLLSSAVDVCNLFISEGMIVSIRGRDVRDDYTASPDATLFSDLPMSVLVDGYSASASEITAACLQDHGRAIIVGQRTWGKGTVQNVMFFEGQRSALKLTIATYWRPSGTNIHREDEATEDDPWGVSPNEGYEVTLDEKEFRKLLLRRRQRDRAPLPDEKPESSSETTSAVERNGTDATTFNDPSDTDDSTDSTDSVETEIDLTGFQDRQLQRAIDAINAQRTSAPTERTEK